MLCLLQAASVLALSGCAAKVKQEFDAELGATVIRMNQNKIGRSGSFTLYVDGVRIEQSDTTKHAVWVEARGLDWVRADNLTLFVDEREIDFGKGERFDAEVICFTKSNLGSSLGINPIDRCNFREVYSFPATEDQLFEVAHADRVILRITGYDLMLLKSFSDGNIARFRDFVSQYLTSDGSTPVLRHGEDDSH